MKLCKLTIITILATFIFAASSCSRNFNEINTNPNTLPAARPESLLESALYDVVQKNQTRALRLTHELMQVHVTVINSDEIHRYIIRPSESDYMWNNWYLQLTNFKDMYKSADFLNQTSYMGIARIMEAWIFSLLTDTYGNVPYSEALRGKDDNIYQPKFDEQKDIYAGLFAKLEEANTLLAQGGTIVATKDPLYAGDVARWRKFGNTLYLRLLLRASGRTESNAIQKIKEIVETNTANYPIFTNNAESAVLRFTTTPPYVSAFNTYRDYDFNGDNGLSQFFINTLNYWEDPRRPKWATTVGSNYEGIPSGYASGNQPERLSAYLATLKNEPLLGNIINYPELQFILAEAALKGYITGNPKTYYEAGVQNAITLWALTVPAGHLTKPGIQWIDAETTEQKMEKIMLQKYFAFFFTDFQSWFEHRRTGFPTLPQGPGLQNNGIMPTRLVYPVSVQTLNRTNYDAAVAAMGGDDMNSKVWWDNN
jgi:hypothetical protein